PAAIRPQMRYKVADLVIGSVRPSHRGKRFMRPYIICHMGTSIDGRLHPSRFTRAAPGISWDVLRAHYEKIHDRFEADGWIVGRKTMSEMAKGSERSPAQAQKLPREAHIAERRDRK